jgi:NAD(P)H dehydrogenase (quinone)
MTIVVTGATGHLGRHVVEGLLARGVPAAGIVATGRNVDAIADLAARGVTVRRADFDDPASLKDAFAGADRLLLVSASEIGKRIPQHRNAVDAAKEAGVSLLAYTSAPKADDTPLLLAAEHRDTEEYIRASGVPAVILRNSWYFEVYTAQLATQLEHGAVTGAAGTGRFSPAARRDYAEAAAAVLVAPDQAGRVYELGGDTAITLADYAAEVARQSGRPVAYQNLSVEAYTRMLEGFGLPTPVAEVIADADAGIERGDLLSDDGSLSRLIGRPTTTVAEAVRAALS